jgi:hypothetical protein
MKDTDYRVVHWHENGKDTFAIHQVYYDERDQPQRISDDCVKVQSDDVAQLKDQHFHIAAAFLQDILPGHLYKSNLTTSSVMDTFFPKK